MKLESTNTFKWEHPELEGMDIVKRTISEQEINKFEEMLSRYMPYKIKDL